MTDPAVSEQVDRLRMQLADYFRRLPEVPVYRRRDDPVIKQATERADEGRALLTQAQQLSDAPGAPGLVAALQAHLEVLELIKSGKVESAEGPWHKALALERQAVSAHKLWSRTDEVRPPVFDRQTGESRFDPRPEPTVKVKIACPNSGCRAIAGYDFSARHSTHLFACESCQTHFYAYFAELLDLQVETKARTHHRYHFRVRELNGEATRVDFDDGGEAQLSVARGDLLAFLYAPRNTLRGVLDLSSSRVLWVRQTGPCFLATAVYGEGAAELDVFRGFRDRVLLPTRAGRLAVRAYYALGPGAARLVQRRPALSRWTRSGLDAVHAWLVRG